MKSRSRLFAELTACLEDAHAIAIEGQASDHSPDLHSALLASLKGDLTRVTKIAALIESRLELGR